ncbi:MAG: putative rane protein [Gemmatimonadetes bacterium]|nr:putative rane protein [Gemmatimonadota bacterium]
MKIGWRGALGIILSAACLYFAFRGIAFAKVLENLRHANLGLLLLSVVVATCTFPLRALRWRPILDPIAPNLPFTPLFSATVIGMMINNVALLRAGEVARAYALSRSTPRVTFPAAFASLAVDRVFDVIVVFGLMFLAMLDPAFPPEAQVMGRSVSSWALKGVVLVGVLVVAMYLVVLLPERILALYESVARRIAPKLEARGRAAIVAIIHGMSILRTPGRLAAVLGWTVAHWLCNALAFWLAFRAFGITTPMSSALFLQGLVAIGVAAPQGPGFFGVFELFGQAGLGLYGVPSDLAVSWAITYHVLTYIPVNVIGAYYFLRTGLSMGEIGTVEKVDEPSAAAV